jgi:hypothetical protein
VRTCFGNGKRVEVFPSEAKSNRKLEHSQKRPGLAKHKLSERDVEFDAKTKCCSFAISFLLTEGRTPDQRVLPPRFASGFALFCYGLEFALASVARTDFAQMFETVNSGRMAIRKFYLDCVIPHCCGALSRYPGLKHG